jgi:hypothetical protein
MNMNIDASESDVASAQAQLAKDAISGGNLALDSEQQLRAAADAGVAANWINRQVAAAEQVVTASNCDSCFTILERGRQ